MSFSHKVLKAGFASGFTERNDPSDEYVSVLLAGKEKSGKFKTARLVIVTLI